MNGIGLEQIKGVGPQRRLLLERLGIFTLDDLFYFAPRRYEDRRTVKKIDQLVEGEIATVQGEVTGSSVRRGRRYRVFKMRLKDDTGRLSCHWFNQPYLAKQLPKKTKLIITGKVSFYKEELQINAPEFEILSDDLQDDEERLHVGRIVPIYPLTEGFSQKVIRRIVAQAIEIGLDHIQEIFPTAWCLENKWMPRQQAILELHFPSDNESLQQAYQRLVFEEFLVLQLGILKKKSSHEPELQGTAHHDQKELVSLFLRQLPFDLTGAQQRVLNEIWQDMQSQRPMSRLLQGDVGAGKTVVAMAAMAHAVSSGRQAALMAPTEILAEQHAIGFKKWFEPLGIKVGLLRSQMKAREKRELLDQIEQGQIDCVIGTHALIEQKVVFQNLSLVVIDEQHKFGVMQRARLRQKGGEPDLLVMTATPIPRTLALTLYGDLEVSLLNELPPGKAQIKTHWITEKKLEAAFIWIKEEIKKGRQVYILYPMIEESEKVDLKAAVERFDVLKKTVFKEERMGLLHGRLPFEEKEKVMQAFKNGSLDILVSTTVIEVGIDISNATVMVIENAERFGLAQLHQLRGRVGRGKIESHCILVGKPKTEEGKKRLKTMIQTQDGFKIAEKDLEIRGPGEFFGLRQHGIPALRIGDLVSDFHLMELAHHQARHIVDFLSLPEYTCLQHHIFSRFHPIWNDSESQAHTLLS